MSDEILAPRGIWYFVTISLVSDYTPSEAMLKLFRKMFSCVYVVQEGTTEEGTPKLHVHLVGLTARRQDNIRTAIMSRLKKDDCVIDDSFSVKVIATPKPEYELGYLQKESTAIVLLNQDISDQALKNGKEWFESLPKRQRKEKRGSFNLDRFIADAKLKCQNREDIKAYLSYAQDEGLLTFSQYQKLNVKKMVEWILREWNVD